MEFTTYMNAWVKSEVAQGRIMIGLGVVFILAFYGIFRGQHELLKGALIPLALLILVLIGYGSFILFDRPAHAKESIALFESSSVEGIEKEQAKHINDNKAGKTLMRFVYPSLILVSGVLLFVLPSFYYKGMSIGFLVLFAATYIIDYGFVSRSDRFLEFLGTLA